MRNSKVSLCISFLWFQSISWIQNFWFQIPILKSAITNFKSSKLQVTNYKITILWGKFGENPIKCRIYKMYAKFCDFLSILNEGIKGYKRFRWKNSPRRRRIPTDSDYLTFSGRGWGLRRLRQQIYQQKRRIQSTDDYDLRDLNRGEGCRLLRQQRSERRRRIQWLQQHRFQRRLKIQTIVTD